MDYKKELNMFFIFWGIILLAAFYNLTDAFYEKFNFNDSLSDEIQVLSILKEYKIDNYFDDIHIEDDELKALVKPSIWQVLTDEQKDDIENILNKECKKGEKKYSKVHIVNIK